MRTAIFVLLIAIGLYAQFSTRRLLDAERRKTEAINKTMREVHDIVNNFLNNLLLFRMEAEDSNAISAESLEHFDKIVDEAKRRVRVMDELD